jgi:hypothetical protein
MKSLVSCSFLSVVIAAGVGCAGMFAKRPSALPAIEQFPDGTRTVSAEPMPLQVRAPDGTRPRRQPEPGGVELTWGIGGAYVRIDMKAEHTEPAGKIAELDATLRVFQLAEQTQLDDGYDLYYSYLNSAANKRIGYYSERTIEGTRYRCYLLDEWGLEEMKIARQMCRSAQPLATPAAAAQPGA